MNTFTYLHRTSARFFAVLAVLSLLMGMLPIQAFAQAAPLEEGSEQILENVVQPVELNPDVTICHATESAEHPYSKLNVDAKSIVNLPNGHDDHNDGGIGDVGDIIPPFDYDFGSGLSHYAGKNWTNEGQEILRNDCSVPEKHDPVSNVKLCKIGGTGVGVKNFELTLTDGEHTFGAGKKTDNKGCFTVEVPYGTYTFDEIMPSNKWINVLNEKGIEKGAQLRGTEVVVNEENEKFTLQNMQCGESLFNFGDNQCQAEPQFIDVAMCKVGGTGSPMKGWELHLGNLSGVTEESTGCFTLTDVPFGDYVVDEVMKGNNWVNVAGEGYVSKGATVTVSKDTNTFTLKNRECEIGTHNNGENQCVPDENQCVTDMPAWADTAASFTQGNRKDNGVIAAGRSNKDSATGVADWTPGGSTGFVSLGFGGSIVVKFAKFVVDVPGDDLSFHEATNGTYPVEKAKIEVSKDGSDWRPITEEARNDVNEGGAGVTLVDFSETGLNWIKYVRITDTSDISLFANKPDADGYDLDAVDATKAVCDQPQDEVVLGCTDPEAINYNKDATPGNPDAEECRYEEAVCEIGDNLLANGSFEADVVTDHGGDWQIFPAITNWVISLSDGLELWANGFYGGASDGNQNAELDGNSPTKIAQNVTTTPGALYELRFDFSARPDRDSAADNSIDALVDGNLLMNVTADGSDIAANTWSTHSKTFTATGASTEIAFEDKGTANSYGSLMDNAVLCKVREPEPAEACSVTIVSDTTNTVTEKAGATAALAWTHANWISGLTDSVAQWIWGTEYVENPTQDETETFVKTFNWNGPVASALLDIATDNSYIVKLNGVQVAADANLDNFTAADENIDVSAQVVTGLNKIEIAVTNKGVNGSNATSNPAGLLYNLTIVGNTSDDCHYVSEGGGDGDGDEDGELSCTLKLEDRSIHRGDNAKLEWTTTGATSASITSVGDVSSELPNGDAMLHDIDESTTYTMTVTDDNDNEATCSDTVVVYRSGGGGSHHGGGGGGSSNTHDGEVAGASDSKPEGKVLGEQVSVVPLGAADAGAGSTSPVAIPSFGLVTVAFMSNRRMHA